MKNPLRILLFALMAVTVVLVGWAIVAKGSDTAISINIIWGYILVVAAVAVALIAAVKGMLVNPAGIKKAILSVVLVVIVIGVATGIALSHSGLQIPNSEGGFFTDPFEVALTEASIIVTYITFVAAIVIAVYSVIRNALK